LNKTAIKGDGEVIQFLDGVCWGVAPNGETVYCGTEDEVKAILADPTKKTESPLVNDILGLERELRKELEIDGGIQRKDISQKRHSSVKRGGLVRGTEHQGGYTKKVATGKRVPIR